MEWKTEAGEIKGEKMRKEGRGRGILGSAPPLA
jgi:hypothetical protein